VFFVWFLAEKKPEKRAYNEKITPERFWRSG